MTDATHTPSTAPLQAESAASSELSGLNARTARRQKLLLGSLGALALLGGSWFILGGDDKAKTSDPNAAQTIDTAGLVNRDLSQREFVATYGNRLDAVTRGRVAVSEVKGFISCRFPLRIDPVFPSRIGSDSLLLLV